MLTARWTARSREETCAPVVARASKLPIVSPAITRPWMNPAMPVIRAAPEGSKCRPPPHGWDDGVLMLVRRVNVRTRFRASSRAAVCSAMRRCRRSSRVSMAFAAVLSLMLSSSLCVVG